MLTKKIFLIIFSIIFIGGFVFGAPNILALTPDEIKEMINELQTQVLYFQARLDQLQKELAEIQKTEEPEKETPSATCHTSPLWDWNYCSSVCKCNAGEGDCDGDFQCNTGYCALDVGAKYGQNRWLDVCEEKPTTVVQPTTPVVTTPTVTPEKKEEKVVAPTCSDTDWFGIGEENLKRRLLMKGVCEYGRESYADACLDDNMLRDYFCSSTLEGKKTCFFNNYYCKTYGFIGCQDGACFKIGVLSLSLDEDNPPSQNLLLGTQDATFLRAKFTASEGEDIKINSLKVCLSGSSQASFSTKLYENNTLIALTQTNPIDNCANFSAPNLIIPKSTSKTLSVKTDIPAEINTPVTLSMEIKGEDIEAIGLASKTQLSSSGSAISNLMTVVTSAPELLCADSDGGINEYVYGKTTKEGISHYDTCFLGDNLKEWACTVAGVETYKLIECEHGCSDGVCKKASGNDNSTGVVCTDSDEGRDYETYGEVIHGDGALIDRDACQSEKTLKENYCEGGYFTSETHECPLGCLNGACLSQSGFKNIENNLAFIAKAISQLMERLRK